MKVICIGDPHFQVQNAPQVSLFIERTEELVKKELPDLIIIMGDLLHTHERLHTIPLNMAYDFIKKMSILQKTIVLVGNHDMINCSQFQTTNHWLNAMKDWENVMIVDTAKHFLIKKYSFIFVPFVPNGRFIDALDTLDIDWKQSTCIFAHQEFYGCKMGAIISVEGDKWEENYPNVVSGHIHDKQTPQPNIYYCGSSMQHSFGENEEHSIAVLEWKNSKSPYKLREESLDMPKKRIIYTDVENIDDIKVPDEDHIKISINGSYEEFKAFKKTKKYKELSNKGAKIIFKQKRAEIKENTETLKEQAENGKENFVDILEELVSKEDNEELRKLYNYIIKKGEESNN